MRNTGADILVVDDEADIRELVSGLLEDEAQALLQDFFVMLREKRKKK